MDIPEILTTVDALRSVRNPRFLATERGYHGAFYCALRSFFEANGLLTKDRILEMEYQKSTRHDIFQRPDIVFHIPTEISGRSVRDNNFAAWALKHHALVADARADFRKLDEMGAILQYPVLIFVNVHSSKTHLHTYSGKFPDRIHAFAVPGPKGADIQYSHFKDGKITHKTISLTASES